MKFTIFHLPPYKKQIIKSFPIINSKKAVRVTAFWFLNLTYGEKNTKTDKYVSHVPSRDCFGHLGKEKKLSPIHLQWFPIGGLFLMVMLQEITFLSCGV